MVVVSMLLHAEIGPTDHREDAFQLISPAKLDFDREYFTLNLKIRKETVFE